MSASRPVVRPSSFEPVFPPVTRAHLETVQVNLGYRCNQACVHCHVDAGPRRTESMSAEVIGEVLRFAVAADARTLDLTGGAPELNPHFRSLVAAAREAGLDVIDRCNLTILGEPGFEDLAEFLAEQAVTVVASLPCYGRERVDAQRGAGVFDASIAGLKRLNALGYGDPASPLRLNLVYNPQGAVLPPPQAALEADYREELGRAYGIRFNHLLTLANMPIARFRHALERDGQLDDYLHLLVDSYDEHNLAAVMCRSLVSIDWRGYLYDCDFNQMLGLPLRDSRDDGNGDSRPLHVGEATARVLAGRSIQVGPHCFGCTAGQGSSCTGALIREH